MSNTDIRKKKIFVIEDNSGILFALKEALLLEGYDVETYSVFVGVNVLSQNPPDLIFLDVFLAAQDGREITRELKADARTKHIPVVLLSAYPGIEELASEAGADGYLAKPFHLEDFLSFAKKYTEI